ncbi:hypothetical protein [Bradyrhizobium iriomotense]|uniref:hypothetical protein n=1 Tax=Bradyrhizobium iriomotense TaxID=441950 RepID=UPI001FE3E0B7|nr:hypothetical protein [Bradyrhizobium iriomotense]
MAINMLSMGSAQPPQLPYLGHNGRELGLMLRGTKPLAYFLHFVPREFDVNIRYWRMFDRHVAAGRFIRRELVELPHRRLLYALPDHEWRIDAMLALLNELEAWSEDHERCSCELLGYEGWQINYWLAHRRSRADA